MNSREKELQELFLNNEKLTLNSLKKAYKDSLNEINVRIAMLEDRSDANMQNVIYQVEYQKALKKQIEVVLDDLQNKEFDTVSQYLTASYEDGFIGTMYNLQGQNIPLVFPIDQEQVVDALKNETKLSSDLYSSFDMKELKKQIQGEISRGIASNSSTKEIAMNISFFAKVKQNNAMRIARTEGHRIQCKASMNACEKAASKGADVVKQWNATLDGNTRESHQAVDGEIRELDEKFSNGLMYPGDPSGGASEVVNCRCSLDQRARWALDREVTKWSPDAPLEVDDDGTTQYYKIPGKDYKEFKENYFKATERVRSNAQMIKYGEGDKTPENLENTGKNGIMKVGQTKAYTKIKVEDIPSMDEEKFKKMKAGLESRGISVIQDADGDAYLRHMNAEAMTLSDGSAVIFQSGRVPSASAMFEEVIHTTQIINEGIIDATGDKEGYIKYLNREISANEKLIRNQVSYGLTKEDVESVKQNLEKYYADLKEVMDDV